MDKKLKSFGGNQRGRIILLGDGTEVLTDSDDTEMFDHGEEDKDLVSQVPKGQPNSKVPESDVLPEKVDPKEPQYQAVVDKVLPKTTDSKVDGDKKEEK